LAPRAGCITSSPSGSSIKIDKLEKEELSSFTHSFKFFGCNVVCVEEAAAGPGLREVGAGTERGMAVRRSASQPGQAAACLRHPVVFLKKPFLVGGCHLMRT